MKRTLNLLLFISASLNITAQTGNLHADSNPWFKDYHSPFFDYNSLGKALNRPVATGLERGIVGMNQLNTDATDCRCDSAILDFGGTTSLVQDLMGRWFGEWYSDCWVNGGTYISALGDLDAEQKIYHTYDPNGNRLTFGFKIKRTSGPLAGQWRDEYLTTFTYDSIGRLTDRIDEGYFGLDWSGGNWENRQKVEFSYDGSDNLISELKKEWNSSGGYWNNSSRKNISFDSADHNDTTLWESWNGADWENQFRNMFFYDQLGNLTVTVVQNWDGNGWINTSQHTSAYDFDGHLTSYIWENWDGNEWYVSARYLYGYDAGGNCVSYSFENWEADTIASGYRQLATYDQSGSMETVISQNWESGSWVNDYRAVLEHDGSGNTTLITLQREENIGLLTVWVNSSQLSFGYNATGIMTSETAVSLLGNGSAETTFEGFFNCSPLGLEDASKPLESLIYPNPSNGHFTLKTELKGSENIQIEIRNALGQLIYTSQEKVPSGLFKKQVDLDVSEGIYYMTFRTEQGTLGNKLIITQ